MTQTLSRPSGKEDCAGLHRGVLSPIDVLGQSIAGIAPTAAPAFSVAISFGLAGNGAWLAYALATGMMLLTAFSINQFARRSSSPGSLYTYVTMGLGPKAGFITALSLVAAYVSCSCSAMCSAAMFFNSVLSSCFGNTLEPLIGILLLGAGIAYIAYRNIQLSTKTMLWLEGISVLLIVSLFAAVLVLQKVSLVDQGQIGLSGSTPEGIHLALILAIFAFVGFESSASLGVEASNPKRTIPRSIVVSTLVSGFFFVASAYIMVAACRSFSIDLGKCQTPLSSLAAAIHMPAIGVLTSAGAGISLFAAALAAINAAARILMTMSHDGLLHSRIGDTHTENRTPHLAVFFCAAVATCAAVLFTLCGFPVLDIVGWVASFGTYGFIASYFLVSLAAPMFLSKRKQLRSRDLALSALSCLTVLYALGGTIYPVPAAPYNFLPYLFVAYLALGLLFYSLPGKADYCE